MEIFSGEAEAGNSHVEVKMSSCVVVLALVVVVVGCGFVLGFFLVQVVVRLVVELVVVRVQDDLLGLST